MYSYKSLAANNSRLRRGSIQKASGQVTLLVGLTEHGEPFERDYLERVTGLFNDRPSDHRLLVWGEEQSWMTWLRQFRRQLSRVDRVVVALSRDESCLARLGTIIVLARFFGKPVALWYRNPCLETSLEGNGFWLKHLVRLATMVVCPDRHAQRWLGDFGISSHIVSDFVPAARLEMGPVSELQPRILASGPIARRSDLGGLMRAFDLVKQKYPRTELTIVGDGLTVEQIAARNGNGNGNGQWSGVTIRRGASGRELEQLLADCDLYVCSATEAIRPVGLLRAMGAGRPVISTELGSIRTLVKSDEQGVLVPINQPAMIAEQIIGLIESPKRAARLARAGQGRVAGLTFSHARATWRRAWEKALGADQAHRPLAKARAGEATRAAG